MRNKILLSSLSVGRCFTKVVEPGGATEETEGGQRRSDSILPAAEAWKITEAGDGGVQAVNATGETQSFAGDLEVVEIPRQGYDKLAAT